MFECNLGWDAVEEPIVGLIRRTWSTPGNFRLGDDVLDDLISAKSVSRVIHGLNTLFLGNWIEIRVLVVGFFEVLRRADRRRLVRERSS